MYLENNNPTSLLAKTFIPEQAESAGDGMQLPDRLEHLHGLAGEFGRKESERIARGAEASAKTGLTLDVTSKDPAAIEEVTQRPRLNWNVLSQRAPVTSQALTRPELMLASGPWIQELVEHEERWGSLAPAFVPGKTMVSDEFTWGDAFKNVPLQTKKVLDGLDTAASVGIDSLQEGLRSHMRSKGYTDEEIARIEAGEPYREMAGAKEDGELVSPFALYWGGRLTEFLRYAASSKPTTDPTANLMGEVKTYLQEEQPWMRDYELRKELYASGAQELLGDVAGTAPLMAGSALGGVIGGPGGAAAVIAPTIFGMSVNEYEKDPKAQKDRIYEAAALNALLQTPLETLGIAKVLKAFKPATSWGKAAKAWFVAAGSEGTTEYAQSYPERLSQEYVRGLNPGEREDFFKLMAVFGSGQFQKDALYQGLVGFLAGGLFASPGAAANYRAHQRQALAKTAGAEMGRKYPEAYESILSAQVEAGVVPAQVFVPVARLQGLFQEEGGPDPGSFLREIGVEQADFDAALDSDSTVAVPFARIHKFTSQAESLLPFVEMTPEQEAAMAYAGPDAEAVTSRLEADIHLTPEEADALESVMGKPLVDEELQAARQEFKGNLLQATQHTDNPLTREQAAVYAELVDGIAATWAENTGQSPLDWYRQWTPELMGPFATVDDLGAARHRATGPFLSPPHKWAREQDAGFRALVREEGAEARERDALQSDVDKAPLKDRLPWLGHIWGRLDGQSLKRDYPGAYKEIIRNYGLRIFRSAENGGLPVDYLAAELVENRLFQEGMGADELVERLRRPRKDHDVLYQPLNPEVDLEAPVQVVQVQPLFSGMQPWELSRGQAKKQLKSLAGTYRNIATGWDIELTRTGVDHAAGSVGKKTQDHAAHMEAVANLPTLIENALLVETHEDRKGQGLANVHRMYAGMAIGEDLYTVKLTVKEYEGTRLAEIDSVYRLYDSSIEKKTSGGLPHAAIPEGWGTHSTPDAFNTVNLRTLLEGVKDADGSTFFHDGPNQARAAIALEEGLRPIIQFFQSSNISSFGHETAHLLRRQLEDMAGMAQAKPRVREDWQVACDFVEAKPGEQWTTRQEERFADAFLDYLEKGQAPTKRLQRAFRQLARWLSRLYQTVTRHGVQASPEIRGVFDRLLATEAAIDQARAKAEITPALPAALVPETRREEYLKALENMNDAAATEMEKKLLAELSRKKGQWEREGKKLADEYPGHILLDNIADAGGIRLTEDIKEYLWPEAIAAIQAQRPKKSVLSEEGTLDVEVVADENGFIGPDAALQFLDALEKTPPKSELIREYVRQKTEEWRAEWTTDEVVMTEELARGLEVEAGILAERLGVAAVNGEALRQRVENALAQIHMENLEQGISALTAAYTQHAGMARQAAVQAYKDGVLAGEMHQGAKDVRKQRAMEERALEAKEKQRRALEELRARYKAKEERNRILKNIQRTAKAGPDKIDLAYGDQIRALVQRFDMGGASLAVKDPDNLQPLPRFLAEVQTGLMEEAVPVAEWIIARRATPGKKAGWKQLTLEEFRELHEAITWIDHMGRTQKELIGALEKQLVADVAGECAVAQSSLKSREVIADYERKQVFKGARHLLRRALAGITNLEYAFDAADGFRIAGKQGDLDGVHYRHIRAPLMESRRQELSLQGSLHRQLETILAPYRAKRGALSKRWDMPEVPLPQNVRREWGAKPWTFERQIMVALNMGNAGNKKALMAGYGWTQEHLDAITASLTLEDWQMVQRIWDLVDSLYPALNDAYRKINGLPMKKVQASPLMAHGMVLPGGYFPLVADHTLSGKAAELIEEDMFKAHADAMFMEPKLADGFTKERTGSTLPPRLAMSVLTTHLSRATRYITHAVAVRDVAKLTGHPVFAASFAEKFGQEVQEQITPWLRHIARPTRKLLTGWEKGLEYCRFMGTIQGLGLKMGTAALQLTSIPSSAQEIGWGAMAEGMSFVAMNRGEAYQAIRELSPFMRNRSRSLDRDIAANMDAFNPDRRTIRWDLGGKTYEMGWREFQEACFIPMTFTDSIVAYSTWWGAYKKALGETAGDERYAVDYADGAVIRAQSAAHSMNLTEAQRSTGLMKMATMFMTFTMNLQNRTRFYARGVMEGQIPLAEYSRHVWNDLLLQPVLVAFLMGALKGGKLDDPEEYLQEIAYSLISGYPFIRDLQGYLEYGTVPGLVNSLASRGLADFARSIKYGLALLDGEQKKGDEFEKFLRAVLSTAGFFRGVPTQPVWTFIDGARDMVQGKTDNPLRLFIKEKKEKKK